MESELVRHYKTYCDYRNKAKNAGVLDLSQMTWLYPTTILPLGRLLLENPKMTVEPPEITGPANYLKTILQTTPAQSPNKSYVPIIQLPRDNPEKIFEKYPELKETARYCGGLNAFGYLCGELTDNIYQHSEFTNALFMAQRYSEKKFVEMCFLDDGITIPGGFEKHGKAAENHMDALYQALRGESTKPGGERGKGLPTSLKLVRDGLGGDFMIISGKVGFCLENQKQNWYGLPPELEFNGTLISVRVPFLKHEIVINQYIA